MVVVDFESESSLRVCRVNRDDCEVKAACGLDCMSCLLVSVAGLI